MTNKRPSITSIQQSRQPQRQSTSSKSSNPPIQDVIGEQSFIKVVQKADYKQKFSPSHVSLLQGAIGNNAVGKVLQKTNLVQTKAARPQTVLGATNRFVQRGLFDNPLGWLEGKAESATQWVGNKAESAAQWAGNKANNVASWVGDKAGDAESWVGDKAAKIDEIEAEISIILSELKKKIHGVGL